MSVARAPRGERAPRQDSRGPTGPREPRRAALSWPALGCIMVVGAALALAQINQHLILASDNASYIVLGQALAMGRGYVMVNEPLAPPMNLYPPAYPLLLAVVLHASGAVAAPLLAIVQMKLVAAAFYVLTLPLVFHLARRRQGDALALCATLLVAVNPSMLSLATEILSETPFVFCALAGLALVDAAGEQQTGGRRAGALLGLAGVFLINSYYLRTAAMAILAAVPLYLLWRRQWRAGVGMGIALALLALPWLLRSSAPPTPETPFFARSYLHQVLAAAPYSDQTVSLVGLLNRIAANSTSYAFDILPETLFPHLSRLGGLATAAGVALGALAILGLVLAARRRLSASDVAVAAYWLSLSLFVWVLGFRYIIIVLPFTCIYVLAALKAGGEWLARLAAAGRGRQAAAGSGTEPSLAALLLPVAITVILATSGLAVDLRRAERNLSETREQTLAQVYAGDREWARWLEAVDWLAANTPADAVIMGRKPDLLYLLSNRRTAEYPYTQDSTVLAATLRANGVSYVLEDGFTWTRTTETYLAPAMRGLAGASSLLLESPAPATRVWRVRAP